MNSFKSILKRISILSLSLLLTFTSIPVHAETEGENGQNGVNSGNTSSFKGGWSHYRQGYRFYIVNGNKERVSKVVDFVFTDVTDVGNNKWFTNARWESPSTNRNDSSQYVLHSIDDLVRFCTITDEETGQQKTAIKASDIKTIYPMTILKAVHGSEFQEWFIGKAGSGSALDPDSPSSTSGGSINPPKPETKTEGNIKYIEEEIVEVIGFSEVKLIKASISEASTKPVVKNFVKEYKDEIQSFFINKYNYYLKRYPDSSKSHIAQASAKDTWDVYYDILSDYAEDNKSSLVGIGAPISDFSRHIKDSLGYMIGNVYYSRLDKFLKEVTDVDILNINIPLANSADKPLYPADAILTMDDFKVYGFNKEVDGKKGITALDALAYKVDGVRQYYLVVEPLAWINVYTSSTKYESTRTYGSYYNIVEYMYHNVKSNNRASGAHYSYIQMYGKNSLVVKRSFNNPTLDTLTLNPGQNEDYMDVKSVYKAMSTDNYGYGMQIYTGKGETKPHTRTHDPKNPTSPAPAPDDTALLENPADGVKIVKYYEKNNTTVGKYTRTPAPKVIQIDDEKDTTGYALRDWFITSSKSEEKSTYSESKSDYNNLSWSGTTEEMVDLSTKKEATALYVLLEYEEEPEEINEELTGEWVLHESEISKQIITEPSPNPVSWSIEELAKRHEHTKEKACDCYPIQVHDNHNEDDSDDRSVVSSDKLSLTLKNDNESNYPSLLATQNLYVPFINTVNPTRSTMDAYTETHNFNYKFILFRGDDKLTSSGRNSGNQNTELAELGYTNGDTKTTLTRKTKSYNSDMTLKFSDGSTDLSTSASCGHGSTVTASGSLSSTMNEITKQILIEVYSGKKLAVDNTTNPATSLTFPRSSKDKTAGRQISSGSSIVFNPYIRMTYVTQDASGNASSKKEVNVLSEYRRTINPNDYAEIQWEYDDSNTLIVSSNQWATDKRLTDENDNLDWTSPNQVFKGGASYTVDAKLQNIYMNTYQVIVEGAARNVSTIKDGELTKTKAEEEHKKFVDNAIKSLEEFEVLQWVSDDLRSDAINKTGIPVSSGLDLSELRNGSTNASTDSKYYLRTNYNDKKDVMRSDIDVAEKGTVTSYMRFHSDVEGNIYVVEGDSLESVLNSRGIKILTKDITSDKLTDNLIVNTINGVCSNNTLANSVKDINSRTLALTKFVQSIERNSGHDTSASWASTDGRWYNEAYEGIIVMKQKTKLQVGFNVPTKRMTVLDPKLIPLSTDKASQGLKAFVSRYYTDAAEQEPVTEFKGQSIYMKDANLLYTSNKFFIANMTVQNSR